VQAAPPEPHSQAPVEALQVLPLLQLLDWVHGTVLPQVLLTQ
jgi:hypothetical protein